MDSRAMPVLLSAALVFLIGSGVARSQAIPAAGRALRLAAAAPELRYDYPYLCNQEHVVIGHCRHDSDTPDMPPTTPQDDFCQVYYPDRPKRGGLEAMGTELRADLIKTLSACGAFGASAAGPDNVPKASSSASVEGAAPARPGQAGSQGTSKTEMRKQFCDQILQLRALAPQGFQSIDLGPMKGESAEIHATALHLQGTDVDCYISREAGKQANYICSWPMGQGVLHPDDPLGGLAVHSPAEAQFRGMGNLIAHCLGVRPDWSFMSETGVAQLDLDSADAHYELFVAGRWMDLSIGPAKR
jgi:hypothetical protein